MTSPNDPSRAPRDTEAPADMVVKSTEYGQQGGGFVATYIIPTGPIHRAIPLLSSLGVEVRPGFDGRTADQGSLVLRRDIPPRLSSVALAANAKDSANWLRAQRDKAEASAARLPHPDNAAGRLE